MNADTGPEDASSEEPSSEDLTSEPPLPMRFSAALEEIAADEARQRVSVGDILNAMGDRAIAALMLLFALPNVLPTPPGTSGILGVPLLFLSAQLMLGKRPWLPGIVASRSMPRTDFQSLIGRASPTLERIERLLRPRLARLVEPPAEYALGAVCFLLAVILALPIPFGNMLPAFAICILAFAVLGKDGIWAIVGIVAAILSVVVVWGVLYALARAALFLIRNSF